MCSSIAVGRERIFLACQEDTEFPEVYEALSNGKERLIVEAPTGSGKLQRCPTVITKYMRSVGYQKPLLVLSSAITDVVGMQESCKYPWMYRLGGRKRSIEPPECHCVYASLGLAAHWFASDGMTCFAWWSGIFFNELHEAEYDMEFSLL